MSAVTSVAAPRVSDEERTWQELSSWDLGDPSAEPGFTFQDKLVQKLGWQPGYASRVMDEFRRFVFLRICGGRHLVPSPDVDEVWHLSIQYTRRYAAMCRRFCGDFMHHNPSTSNREKVTLRRSYGGTLDVYKELFGSSAPVDIWPIPTNPQDMTARSCGNGCGIIDCGSDPDPDCKDGCADDPPACHADC